MTVPPPRVPGFWGHAGVRLQERAGGGVQQYSHPDRGGGGGV